jgi:hypothetical protein
LAKKTGIFSLKGSTKGFWGESSINLSLKIPDDKALDRLRDEIERNT